MIELRKEKRLAWAVSGNISGKTTMAKVISISIE